MKRLPVCVLGAGSWGTALALVLARHGREVRLYARNAEAAATMQRQRQNARYLPGIELPPSLIVTADMAAALQGAHATVVAVPCAAAADVLKRLTPAAKGPVIAAFKGLAPDSLERSDQLLSRFVGAERMAILSGPSFALEVARGLPTAITMAAATIARAEAAAAFFDDTNFRIYTSNDPIGVALGGALKNVIAIAAGAADGLGLGHNSVAAVVTRGLAEMARICQASGGRAETLMGLSGLGDLVLTCTGDLSRNRRFGQALAAGMDAAAAQAQVGQTVEGVRTAAAACRLAADLGLEVPLMQAVHQVLSGKIGLQEAVSKLLSRPERAEF